MRRYGKRWAALAMLAAIWPSLLFAGQNAHSVLKNDAYRRVFKSFYPKLNKLPGDILVDELEEQIETALLRGSTMAPADLEAKVVEVSREVYEHLEMKLCPAGASPWPRERMELSGIEALEATIPNDKVKHGDTARIVAVLVRILESTHANFCESSDFRRLFP